jgi:hypothetical protein
MPQVHTGYPSGMVPRARPGLLLPDLDGRNNSIPRHPRHYVRSKDRLGSTDRQVAPSGLPQDLPRDSSRPALVRVMHARIAPLDGGPGQHTTEHAGCYTPSGGGVPPSAPAATPSGGGILLGTGASGS